MTMRIMVVEDDSSLREWVVFELSYEGYDVRQAGDGITALRCFRPTIHRT